MTPEEADAADKKTVRYLLKVIVVLAAVTAALALARSLAG